MIRYISRTFRRLRGDDRGVVVIDFIPVYFALVIIVLVIFEIGIAYFLALRTYKAAQLGARIAVVTPAVHTNVPARNGRVNPLGRLGQPCFNPLGNDRCFSTRPGPWVCQGDSLAPECDVASFNRIVEEMQRIYKRVTPEAVTLTYVYRTLGETGGAFVPEVNVTVAPMEFEFAIFRPGRETGVITEDPRTRFGSVSVSAFGENTAGLVQPTLGPSPSPNT